MAGRLSPQERTAKRKRAAKLLARGDSETAVRQALNMGPSTLRSWLTDPEFLEDVERERSKLAEREANERSVDERVSVAGNPDADDVDTVERDLLWALAQAREMNRPADAVKAASALSQHWHRHDPADAPVSAERLVQLARDTTDPMVLAQLDALSEARLDAMLATDGRDHPDVLKAYTVCGVWLTAADAPQWLARWQVVLDGLHADATWQARRRAHLDLAAELGHAPEDAEQTPVAHALRWMADQIDSPAAAGTEGLH